MAQANDHLWDIRKQDRINMESLAKFKIQEVATNGQKGQMLVKGVVGSKTTYESRNR